MSGYLDETVKAQRLRNLLQSTQLITSELGFESSSGIPAPKEG